MEYATLAKEDKYVLALRSSGRPLKANAVPESIFGRCKLRSPVLGTFPATKVKTQPADRIKSAVLGAFRACQVKSAPGLSRCKVLYDVHFPARRLKPADPRAACRGLTLAGLYRESACSAARPALRREAGLLT
ncbi:hypothetical protein IT575_07080 [bacterium]|nr:hypothetical protein [bacterium]